MKIFCAEQIREWDRQTMEREGISSLTLMERAATSCAVWIKSHYSTDRLIYIFCGLGNNGGDGFALARLLYESGYNVVAFLKNKTQKFSEDAKMNLKAVQDLSGVEICTFADFNSDYLDDSSIIVDAIFGTGLNRIVHGEEKEMIIQLNNSPGRKISIDIPSGLFADSLLPHDAIVFRADHTLSFQMYKKSFLYPETGKYCGEVHILDIKLDSRFHDETYSSEQAVTEELVRKIYRRRDNFSHKGSFGKTVVVAGSYGMAGAAVLATKAAAVAGSGITMTISTETSREILQISCAEAIFKNGGENVVEEISFIEDATYAIGPGLGKSEETVSALSDFLKKANNPMVLDADALNILADFPKDKFQIPQDSILTPHPKEFDRLFGESSDSFERTEMAKSIAAELSVFILLKGRYTQIIFPEGRLFYNVTGNPGMAKGGSGDVLTGILGSLMAQGYSSGDAAMLGVWLHGKAGDFAAERFSQEAMLPQNLIEKIPEVFIWLAKV